MYGRGVLTDVDERHVKIIGIGLLQVERSVKGIAHNVRFPRCVSFGAEDDVDLQRFLLVRRSLVVDVVDDGKDAGFYQTLKGFGQGIEGTGCSCFVIRKRAVDCQVGLPEIDVTKHGQDEIDYHHAKDYKDGDQCTDCFATPSSVGAIFRMFHANFLRIRIMRPAANTKVVGRMIRVREILLASAVVRVRMVASVKGCACILTGVSDLPMAPNAVRKKA